MHSKQKRKKGELVEEEEESGKQGLSDAASARAVREEGIERGRSVGRRVWAFDRESTYYDDSLIVLIMITVTGIQTACLLSISQWSSTKSIYSTNPCFPQVTRSVRGTPSSISAMPAPSHSERYPCECHDLFEEVVPYVEAWRWQKETVHRISASLARGEEPPNSVVLLQHPPVYTMGTRSSDAYLRFDKDRPPFELHRTERGGEVTYHGPGQLVMYPIVNLRNQKMDLHWYLRMLEEVVIRALWSSCSLRASRIDGLTGVWVGDFKVAAIGVRVSRWITYHGLALNVNTDLAPFQNIVPCGIVDRPVGSIKQLLHTAHWSCIQSIEPSKPNESDAKHNSLEDATILHRVHQSLLREFAEIFEMEFIAPTNKGPKSIKADSHVDRMAGQRRWYTP